MTLQFLKDCKHQDKFISFIFPVAASEIQCTNVLGVVIKPFNVNQCVTKIK